MANQRHKNTIQSSSIHKVQTVVSKISYLLAETDEPEKVLSKIYTQIKKIFKPDVFLIALRNQNIEGTEFQFPFEKIEKQDVGKQQISDMKETILSQIDISGETETHDRLIYKTKSKELDENFQQCYCFPIKFKEYNHGFIGLI